MVNPLKILVVDDTIVYRKILSDIVSSIEDTELIGTAQNGKIAISKIENEKPDLVMLDIEMPEMDGLETLSIIRDKYPWIDVIMISGVSKNNAGLTIRALNLGAIDFIAKPEGLSAQDSGKKLRESLYPLISLVRNRKYVKEVRSFTKGISMPDTAVKHDVAVPEIKKIVEKKSEPFHPAEKIDVIALGVSTGGPNALHKVITELSEGLKVPILAVQHMPPVFTASLAERLNRDSKISVVEGQENDEVQPGFMYIAPGGRHMIVRNGINRKPSIGIIDTPPVNSCKPAVDVLFRSIGMVYGGNVLTVIMTGMGSDGLDGVQSIKRKGGYSIVQDKQTSVVWGMPGAVAEANAADEILPLDKLAGRIMDIVDKGKNR